MNTPKCCAIVVTHNGQEYLVNCLDSLSRCTPQIDLIVVDNGSQDDTVRIAQSFPEVVLIQTGTNIGFGAANNLGIEHAYNHLNADFVLLINQDAYINSDSWSRFFSLPEEIKDNLVGLMQFGPDDKAFDFNFRNLYISEENCPGLIEDAFFGRLKDYYEAKFLNAAAWVLPRRILEHVGGFSPAFFHYGEDNNYIDRINHWGFKLYLTPHISVIHDRTESSKGSSIYFRSKQAREREIILALSHPKCSSSKMRFFGQIFRWMIKDVLLFKGGRTATSLLAIKLLKDGTVSKVIKHRQRSLHPSSFLQLKDPT